MRALDRAERDHVQPRFWRVPRTLFHGVEVVGKNAADFEDDGYQELCGKLLKAGFIECVSPPDWSAHSIVLIDSDGTIPDRERIKPWQNQVLACGVPCEVSESGRLFLQMPVERLKDLRTFTDFRKAITIEPDTPLDSPRTHRSDEGPFASKRVSSSNDPRSLFPFSPGEDAARWRVKEYVSRPSVLADYKKTRNGMLRVNDSSKLSTYLARGMLSVRSVWAEIRKVESQHGITEGSEWLRFELLWREYFRWLEMTHGEAFYSERGIRNVDPLPSEPDQGAFATWCEGRTGQTFVDANMRELKHTGFMSNRGRQNVASFLIHELRLPWRWGATHFQHTLLDADPVQNCGNWSYLAGVGADPRSFGGGARKFNVEDQAERYDPEGAYRKRWSL